MTGASPDPTPVERAAIKEGYRALIRAKSPTSHLVELVVFGLSKAGMLQSPESAAEMEHLRKDRDAFRDQRNGVFETNGRLLEELSQEQVARLRAENETRTVTRSLNAVTSRVDRAEQRRAELEAVLGSHRDDDRKEIERLRARVSVLEAERAERNPVLHDVQVEAQELRERVAELEAAKRPALRDLPPSRQTSRLLAEARDPRPVEDPHDSPLHHAYRVARDLPAGGAV